jgi:hypothetical protein
MLSSLPHHLLQLSGMTLITWLEKGVADSILSCPASTPDAVNI